MPNINQAAISLISRFGRLLKRPGFWIIFFLFVIFTIPHYSASFGYPIGLEDLMPDLGLTRHAMERILFLIPVIWSGFLFGMKGTIISSIIALTCMLPRSLFISEYKADALFETGAVTIVGAFVSGLSAFSLKLLRREQEYLKELEQTHQELAVSEQRYRSLFENAHDAIWIQDLAGYIITANEATARLTGYELSSLVGMNVRKFLSKKGLNIAHEIRRTLLDGNSLRDSYDQQILRKDGNEAFLRLTASLVLENGVPSAFQLIARDITEEKSMQENLQFYLQQATEAQEEERKRISRELHDETIQELVVLSQQLDILASKSKTLSGTDRENIEKLQQNTVEIMKGVRRLSQDLRPAALDRLGLIPALEWLVSDISEYSGLEIEFNTTGEIRRPSAYKELVLFRITQEALRNVWRHSGATRVRINTEFTDELIKINISDNGNGFTPPKSMGDLAKEGKLGLAGMHERARLIGGNLTVKSRAGEGTTIIIETSLE